MCKTDMVQEMPGHLSTREEWTCCFTTFWLPFPLNSIQVEILVCRQTRYLTSRTSILVRLTFLWYKREKKPAVP